MGLMLPLFPLAYFQLIFGTFLSFFTDPIGYVKDVVEELRLKYILSKQ